MKTAKRSFSIRIENSQRLDSYENKSTIVDKALDLFFSHQEHMKKAEESFFRKQIEMGISDVRAGRTVRMNPNGENMTREMIKSALWTKVN